MDIQRPSGARRRLLRRIFYALLILAVVPLVTMGLARLKPAAPSVDGGTVWPGVVKRGSMLRQVRGLGTLVPEDVWWIAAANDGRVERILVLPGKIVTADTVLLELSNPELELAALDAEFQLKAAEASYIDLRVRLESQRLDQRSVEARVQSDYHQAKLRADANEQLAAEGLLPALDLKIAKVTVEELASRHALEKQRLDISTESVQAQLAVQQTRVDQLRALYKLKRSQVDSLRVRAGTAGVLQQLPVQVGQRVPPGTTLAKVAEPSHLKAELKVQETQAKDILIGQPVAVDTHNGVISGQVMRIDPAVQNGTVTVDVKLKEQLPAGARPDLSVDGTIELERLEDVLFVDRPVQGQAQSTVTLFKLEADGKAAVRTRVKFGRSSVNTIEVLEGLNVGDRVILSDMSAWDAHDRIRLN